MAVSVSLEGRVAIVTGAAGGIGRAIALAMGEAGAAVSVCDLGDGAHSTAAAIIAAGGDATARTCDVSDPEQVEELVSQTVASFGHLDVLVNNAGIAGGGTRLHEMDIEVWDRTIAVNLRGPFLCAKFAIPHLLASEYGAVVNIASTYGVIGAALSPAYCASKAGVVNLTRQMAVDYGPDGLRVNAILPGYVDTDMGGRRASLPPEEAAAALALREARAALQPLGRQAQPDEIARVAVFLASSEASFMTGSIVTVDGGCTSTYRGE
jgi:NAD(P)-dependent dehydrogenase (short-subunit alcohol dehydrogenase family)